MLNDFYGINQMPVDLNPIISETGIQVKFGSQKVFDSGQRGLTITDGIITYIIVRKGGTAAENRYTIFHELGHIYLGHPLVNGKYARTFDINSQYEYQAERFAIDVRAPACVLWGLNIHSAEDIARVCNISLAAARRRAKRMEILYQRNKFLTFPLEKQGF